MHAVDIDVVIADLGCDLTDDARLVFVLHRKHDRSDGKVCLISEEANEDLGIFTDDRTGNRKLTAFLSNEVYNDHAGVALALCTLALNNFDTMGLDALTYIYEAYTSIGMCGEEALQTSIVRDEAIQALLMLGFSPAPSAKVVNAILKDQPSLPVEQVVKLALKMIK